MVNFKKLPIAIAALFVAYGGVNPSISAIGNTPLRQAANNGARSVAGLLIPQGTPLSQAANNGARSVAGLLIPQGTPLRQAANNGSEDVADLLLR